MSGSKVVAISLLSMAEVLAMAVWFSGAAVLPSLQMEYPLSSFHASLFTSAVQAGFVAGTLVSALFMLPDRFDPRHLFCLSAIAAAAANLSVLAIDPTSPAVVVLRFVTGMGMAGVYPVGMRIAASWARGDMGLLIGLLVGALTLGSASPHLLAALGQSLDWRMTFVASSALALIAGLIILLVRLGPNRRPSARVRPQVILEAWRNRPLRLANLGYLGHMWELYAMWAWIGLFLYESFSLSMPADSAAPLARLATFATVGVGALGSLAGGVLADRFGRTTLTIGAMLLSGSCALAAGALFGAPPALLVAVCLVWGVSIIADSAQFSASVAELSPADAVGTMLTLQTCLGFLLTLVTIHAMPYLVDAAGWGLAMAVLALGPFLGVAAMARLRAAPEATKLANGRR